MAETQNINPGLISKNIEEAAAPDKKKPQAKEFFLPNLLISTKKAANRLLGISLRIAMET